MRLGEVIRKWRLVEDRTLRDVAGEIGVSHGTLQRIERGEKVDSDTLMKLFNWLTQPPPRKGRK